MIELKDIMIIICIFIGCATQHSRGTVISDADAGYNQAAYDECVDSSEDLDCDDI